MHIITQNSDVNMSKIKYVNRSDQQTIT